MERFRLQFSNAHPLPDCEHDGDLDAGVAHGSSRRMPHILMTCGNTTEAEWGRMNRPLRLGKIFAIAWQVHHNFAVLFV